MLCNPGWFLLQQDLCFTFTLFLWHTVRHCCSLKFPDTVFGPYSCSLYVHSSPAPQESPPLSEFTQTWWNRVSCPAFLFLLQVFLRNWCLLCGCSLFIFDALLWKPLQPHHTVTITDQYPLRLAGVLWCVCSVAFRLGFCWFFSLLIGLMTTSREVKNSMIKGKLLECNTEELKQYLIQSLWVRHR